MTAAKVEVVPTDVVVTLRPAPGANYVTAEDLSWFARSAVANAGPTALIVVGSSGLNAHRSITASALPEGGGS